MMVFPDTSSRPLILLLLTAGLRLAPATLAGQSPIPVTSTHPVLTGQWRIDISKSDDPFTMMSFDTSGAATRPQGNSPGGRSRGGGGGGGFGGRGRGGMGGGGGRGGGGGQPRGEQPPQLTDAQRAAFRQALRFALYPPSTLQITQDDSTMAFGADTMPLVLHADGRTLVIPAVDTTDEVQVTARWLGNAFLVKHAVVGGGWVTEDYLKTGDAQITIYVHFDGGLGRSLDFRRVYTLISS